MADFNTSINYVLNNEGGFVDCEKDHGAATNFGITVNTLSDWRKRKCSADDIEKMGIDEAKKIYLNKFWKPLLLSQASQSIATCCLDMAALFGLTACTKYIQGALNMVGEKIEIDGHMGPVTMSALNQKTNSEFIKAFHSVLNCKIEQIIASDSSQRCFRHSWVSRVDRLLKLI